MDIDDLSERLIQFANSLRRDGSVVADSVRQHGLELMQEVQQAVSEYKGVLVDKFHELDANVRYGINAMESAFSEEDIHTILTAISRTVLVIIRDIVSGAKS